MDSPLVTITRRPDRGPRRGLYIKTFGCQMNEYDSRKLEKILEREYVPVPRPEDASLVIVNTCSVREKPEHKLYSLLGEIKELKERNPDTLVGVGGCVAQQEGDALLGRSPAVDFVFGTHNLSLVPSLVENRRSGRGRQVAVGYRDGWEDHPLGFLDDGGASVFVSISRGCNKRCSYCIVPTTRGPEVSRSAGEIEREVRIAVRRGVKEVVLLGQTVNSYGLDLSPRLRFSELLRRVAAVPGVERIRFTSPHPQEIRSDFIEAVCEIPQICRHLHMPLQSGSDRILKAMNRNYRRAKYMKIIDSVRARVPDMGFTTDLIVGFPGETDEDFRETLDVMREVGFQNSYSFAFSKRPGTPAEKMDETVTQAEKLARLKELQALQEVLTSRNLDGWLGKTCEVLFDRTSAQDASVLQGKNSQGVTLHLERPVAGWGVGTVAPVGVTGRNRFTLRGSPLHLDRHDGGALI